MIQREDNSSVVAVSQAGNRLVPAYGVWQHNCLDIHCPGVECLVNRETLPEFKRKLGLDALPAPPLTFRHACISDNLAD